MTPSVCVVVKRITVADSLFLDFLLLEPLLNSNNSLGIYLYIG